MAKKPPDGQFVEQANQERQQLDAAIGRHVLHTLGQPGNLQTVQIRRLWENHYRVNVVIGQDVTSARIANSYFLVADGSGNIVEATPKITRQY